MYPTVWWLIGKPSIPHETARVDGDYKETSRLADVRFTGGATSLLEVLTTQQQYSNSELELTQAWEGEMQSYVQLYQALGGGW
jgi:multidrug efflux system outer membrane protein